jgi:hypothetical protein
LVKEEIAHDDFHELRTGLLSLFICTIYKLSRLENS